MWQSLKNRYHWLRALCAAFYYGFPSRRLKVIAVTGTSGKTTTCHLIYEILKEAGEKVSLISTIEAVIGNNKYDTGLHVSTPDPAALQRYLSLAVRAESRYFVLEVTSHGLDQNRAAFIDFHTAVLTTLSHEHLDYHKTHDRYVSAKYKLFLKAKNIVMRRDDLVLYRRHLQSLGARRSQFSFFAYDNIAENLMFKLPPDYSRYNILAAVKVSRILGIEEKIIKQALQKNISLPGRYETVYENDFRVIIDFAHKPDALEAALKRARRDIKSSQGRLMVMFGCAGERDTAKRPMMGAISAGLADITVLTDEDPRNEDPQRIINEIAGGCVKAGAKEVQSSEFRVQNINHPVFLKIPDRQKAIDYIIGKLAVKGDLILLCGKGHESSMCYGRKELPWNEHQAVKKALK